MRDEHASTEHPTGGLITQRMAAERGRGAAIYFIAAGCFFLVQAGVRGFDLLQAAAAGAPAELLPWLLCTSSLAVGVGFFVGGVLRLRSRAQRIAAFDAEHGVDAGRQPG